MKSTAKHWRRLARDTRALAAVMANRDTQHILLGIAEGYDRLAELADKSELGQSPTLKLHS